MNWMAWTGVTATFFSVIACILVVMTILEMKFPSIEKRGFLPMATTRGDKLFISLLSSAFIHLGYLAFIDTFLWVALCISILWSSVVFKWG